jgi:hypothetical protein
VTLRARIAEIVERHLDEITDETMAIYVRRIPTVARATPEQRALVRAATMRAARAFLALYAEPTGPARDLVAQARAATIERSGEIFERADIIEMIRLARRTFYSAARRFVEGEIVVTADQRAEVERQLDAFLDELERSDEIVTRVPPDALADWLARAEHEEPDLS